VPSSRSDRTVPRLRAVAAVATVVALAGLAVAAGVGDRFPGDGAASSWVQSWQAGWLDAAMKLVSLPGSTPVAVLLLVVATLALALRGLRTEAALVAAVTASASVLRVALKLAVARPRPTEDLVRVVDQADGYSFPSGHAMHHVVFLGMLGVVLWDHVKPGPGRRLLVAAVGALLALVGLSRVYLGVHWPSDVLGAYAFGGAVVVAAVWGRRSFASWRSARGRDTGSAPTN
jgi:undecaprenyl-diphosphatase